MLLPDVVKTVWDTWNIRGQVILSLSVQSFLILCAPLRKQMGATTSLMISIWMAYLLADWVATFTIGLIFRAEYNDIMALWAPFLLLHLGGPDTITSFSLEDNEFWIRRFLGLLLQVGTTVYVILQSINENKFFLPTLLVFFVGVIKNTERNTAFYHACFDHYGDKIPNVSFLEETAATERDNHSRFLGIMLRKELAPYGTIKNLLVGPLLSPHRRNLSRKAFLQRESKDVLNMMEIELSLLYEALYTKLPVVHCKIGHILRLISLGCLFGALVSFILITKSYNLEELDIWLTYSLLILTIVLEFISIGLLFGSDFNLLGYYRWVDNPVFKILVWNKEFDNMSSRVKERRRWSKTVCQYNFITKHFNGYPHGLNRLVDFLSIRIIDFMAQNLEERAWDFIFCELKRKAQHAGTVEKGKQLCLQRGDGILDGIENYGYGDLIWSVTKLDYTESLLTWHVATEICFQFDKQNPAPDNMDYRKISKLLSDYMFYLLEMQPPMMATVSLNGKVVCKQAYHDMKSFFSGQSNLDAQSLSTTIFSMEPPENHVMKVRGFERTSVILGARKLAHQLRDPNSGFPWKLISRIWVELMCYAAINCRPNVHAQQPSKGGQLLTFVWLLMNHLGLGTQFSSEQLSHANGTEREEEQP